MPVCIKCGIERGASEFYPQRRACKPCEREQRRIGQIAYRAKYPDRVREQRKTFLASHPTYWDDWWAANADKAKEYEAKKNARLPERRKAHSIVCHALERGEIAKPATCSKCDATRIEAHHVDYSKPLEVVWLCRIHHVEAHRVDAQ